MKNLKEFELPPPYIFLVEMTLQLFLIIISNCIFYSLEREDSLIWVNLKGWRYDYITENNTPFLFSKREEGVSSKNMFLNFLSTNLPNYFTDVTGRHIENHGVVANKLVGPAGEVWDENSTDPRFWNQDGRNFPIWVLNEIARNGRKSAVIQSPGGNIEYSGFRSTIYVGFDNGPDTDIKRLKMVEDKFDDDEQLNFIHVTLFDVYNIAKFDPHSVDIIELTRKIDSELKELVEEVRDEFKKVNFIITSDAGFALMDPSRIVYLSEYTNETMDVILEGPTALINCESYETCEKIESSLRIPISLDLENGNETLPDSRHDFIISGKSSQPTFLHYWNNSRIADIFVTHVRNGCILGSPSSDHSVCNGAGNGYLNYAEPYQKPVFIAFGSAFNEKTSLTKARRVDIYQMACYALRLTDRCPKFDGEISRYQVALKPRPLPKTPKEGISSNVVTILIILAVITLIVISGYLTVYFINRKRVSAFVRANNVAISTLDSGNMI